MLFGGVVVPVGQTAKDDGVINFGPLKIRTKK
jgi:hypothetical protein